MPNASSEGAERAGYCRFTVTVSCLYLAFHISLLQMKAGLNVYTSAGRGSYGACTESRRRGTMAALPSGGSVWYSRRACRMGRLYLRADTQWSETMLRRDRNEKLSLCSTCAR